MTDPHSEHWQYKRITAENLVEPDPTTMVLTLLPVTEEQSGMSQPELWVHHALAPQLDEGLPPKLYGLYETARAAVVYGLYYYPLYSLAMGRLYQVADAATVHRCRELQAPKRQAKTFAQRVAWLDEHGLLTKKRRVQWDATRELRNYAVHPEQQDISLGTWALSDLEITADLVNDLFRAPDARDAEATQ